jgi:hypothetical protein
VAPSRHPLQVATAWLLPLAIALALAGAAVAHAPLGRALAGVFALLGGVAWWWQQRLRPVLVVDDDGYAIEQRGVEKLRVRWAEVHKVRYDKRESALYLDAGDAARNLLVPPRRGYGFRFAGDAAVCARVLASVPAERVLEVERLDTAAAAKTP